MSDYHPHLPEGAAWAVDIIVRNAAQDTEYLLDSPYTPEEIGIFERLAGVASGVAEDEIETDEPTDKWGRLEKESNKLFKMLTEFSGKLDAKDNTEQMAYFRTATSLLDKIVGIQERSANLKQINLFHEAVLTTMEDVLEPEQRTAVLENLRNAIKPQG